MGMWVCNFVEVFHAFGGCFKALLGRVYRKLEWWKIEGIENLIDGKHNFSFLECFGKRWMEKWEENYILFLFIAGGVLGR